MFNDGKVETLILDPDPDKSQKHAHYPKAHPFQKFHEHSFTTFSVIIFNV